MNRLDATRRLLAALADRPTAPIIASLGHPAYDLSALADRPANFYQWGSMGLASSMGLGLALARADLRVFVVDGDGSLLMNLGGLTTLARYRPRNLLHVVFDNHSLLSVGGFPTATATGSDLEAIARGAGVPRSATVRSIDDFTRAFGDANAADDLTTIVAKVEAIGPKGYVTELGLLENRFEFQRHLKSLRMPAAEG
jgi:sulfopyruvate decarboxylase subunit beta